MDTRKVAAAILVFVLLLGVTAKASVRVAAQEPARQMTIVVPYTEYEWWMFAWGDNQILCHIFTDHEGLPTVGEAADACGEDLAEAWFYTPPCQNPSHCPGVYLHLAGTQAKERQVIIQLPPATVWVSLEECELVPPENRCPSLPTLVLTGEEPLPDESIVAVQGSYEGEPFYCAGDVCKIPLRPTPLYGAAIEFWADSSYGDSSEHFTAQVRVIDTGVMTAPGEEGWYIDVLSSQWIGPPLASCTRYWEVFPPVGGPPDWLKTPDDSLLLSSEDPYYYLAGRLISQGLVDVSMCPTNGLLPNGYADTCGLEKARPMVAAWQNQFDQRILEVARETGVPAQLMKNLFAQESQFWPGVFRVPFEFGLGQLTDKGADSVLLWNPDFFSQFCPLVLSETACSGGYLSLRLKDQAILRGALALQAKADCPDCPAGVNLSNVHFTVMLFANTLQAGCAQISRTIYTVTNGHMPGTVSNYEDLWRFTIANYHAGPGCLSYAMHGAWDNRSEDRLTWPEVSNYFTDTCKGVIPYVDEITH
ncbi:MAG: hypothetical protein AB1894_14105 [Chloroflexota bacterium]